MALSNIAAKLNPEVPHKTCAVCFHMEQRGEKWADELRTLLRNRGVRFKDLADALREDPDEPDIPSYALSRHASATCAAREKLR